MKHQFSFNQSITKFEYVLLNENLDEALAVAENLITEFLTK